MIKSSYMARIEPFEQHASEYEDWFAEHRLAYESELQAVKQQLPESAIGIEIGVGSGRFAAPLGIKLGLEPSPKMSKIAQRRGIQVVGGVAEAIPFGNSTFDFALMVTTICFVHDPEASLKEAHRILKPNGCLIIGFVDRNSAIGSLYERHKENNVFYRMATFYSPANIISLLARTGFKDLGFAQTIFKSLSQIDTTEPTRPGYGEGSFIVVRATKNGGRTSYG
jgi:SAM-dependent methyltransferase